MHNQTNPAWNADRARNLRKRAGSPPSPTALPSYVILESLDVAFFTTRPRVFPKSGCVKILYYQTTGVSLWTTGSGDPPCPKTTTSTTRGAPYWRDDQCWCRSTSYMAQLMAQLALLLHSKTRWQTLSWTPWMSTDWREYQFLIITLLEWIIGFKCSYGGHTCNRCSTLGNEHAESVPLFH